MFENSKTLNFLILLSLHAIQWYSSSHESCSTSSQTLEFYRNSYALRATVCSRRKPLVVRSTRTLWYRPSTESVSTECRRTVTDYVIKGHLFWPKLDDLEMILLSSHYASRKVFAPLKADCHFSDFGIWTSDSEVRKGGIGSETCLSKLSSGNLLEGFSRLKVTRLLFGHVHRVLLSILERDLECILQWRISL